MWNFWDRYIIIYEIILLKRRMLMFSKKLKKALAVIVAGTVIASSFASMPVYAAVTPETAAITQSYSIANYDSDREFTVKRFGDLQAYSKNQLVMHFGSNNRIPTNRARQTMTVAPPMRNPMII